MGGFSARVRRTPQQRGAAAGRTDGRTDGRPESSSWSKRSCSRPACGCRPPGGSPRRPGSPLRLPPGRGATAGPAPGAAGPLRDAGPRSRGGRAATPPSAPRPLRPAQPRQARRSLGPSRRAPAMPKSKANRWPGAGTRRLAPASEPTSGNGRETKTAGEAELPVSLAPAQP